MTFKPTATYRIQFHKDFTFKHLDKLIPYFVQLGVKTIYASPIFTAIPGSTHGYDGVNPHQLNPEIGTEEELIQLIHKLKKNEVSWVQDIVPNHVSFHSDNVWLMDVLEKWKESEYFEFFDVDVSSFLADKRLMVPFLGEPLPEAIQNKSLTLVKKGNKLFINYGEHHWPLNQISHTLISNDTKGMPSAARLKEINSNETLLEDIINLQYYRPCHWQETERQINYRRFFTVNSLICLNIQNEKVFNVYHEYIFELINKGLFQGIRIDHVDGLFDPTQYLQRLREKIGDDIYIVAEKILATNEPMPQNWPIEGSTGYDFLSIVNNLFTNKIAEQPFTNIYTEVIKKPLDVAKLVVAKKRDILLKLMQGELDHLVKWFITLKLGSSKDLETLKAAIADFLVYCPVYRFYANSLPLTPTDRKAIESVLNAIPRKKNNSKGLALLEIALLSNKKNSLLFYQRCMQFSGPLMAKGVEDTLMYTYNRFIGHTEVGDAPDAFGISTSEFHDLMAERLKNLPFSMNATATHDTKRGEDVRARLNVLTDLPEKWIKLVRKLTTTTLTGKDKNFGLHQNDAYLIFQTVLGAMSFENVNEKAFEPRLMEFVEKALREAKKRSTWAAPNEEYEKRAKEFALNMLDLKKESHSLIHSFLNEITDFSILNSLSQLLLKFTCPGIPDVYQGTELWDLSLVDPDNRRPVDFKKRQDFLEEMNSSIDLDQLWKERKSGKPKLWLTKVLLNFRNTHQELFDQGFYIPVQVKGKYKKNILSFIRQYQDQWLIVVIPLGLAGIIEHITDDVRKFDWKDTHLILPPHAPRMWENVLTNQTGRSAIFESEIAINDLFNELPIALLQLKAPESKRGSGILMPIFSLPSRFGMGDIGTEAYKFVDFLAETGQKYWQLLPLNPISESNFESPYSSNSAMAGNTLFISLEGLVSKGLLDPKDLKVKRISDEDTVEYAYARKFKNENLKQAYLNFTEKASKKLREEFDAFCEAESYWLTDYSLFLALHQHHKRMPWNKWPLRYRSRDRQALHAFSIKYKAVIEEINWQQFIFHQQWQNLRAYAKAKNIEFIGDLPFYVAFDSADVWANPTSFKLNSKLEMDVVAGVPPDQLNEDGQRWGMPIYNWNELKKNKFSWWMERIKRNIELFDLVRIDHFRAIHTFWEIPVGDETAKGGEWIAGPADLFLNEVCSQFHHLPFVLEDLGGDMEGPIALRDEFKLTGMKVLQFGFGKDMPHSTFLPHLYEHDNFMVYIGTHDNNTAKGWFKNDLDDKSRANLKAYLGTPVSLSNVHTKMIILALSSSARIAIFQTQDLIGLDEKARMNVPGTIEANWLWKMKENVLNETLKKWLLKQTIIFGRI